MKTKYYFFYILVAGITFFSCMERINLSTEASPPRLVIYGFITTDTTQHAIRITRSTGFFVTDKPEGVSNAIVRITYDGEIIEMIESLEEKGLYVSSPDVFGIAGKTYTLHASVDFNRNGKKEDFEAATYLPFPATIDSAKVMVSPIGTEFLQVLIWGNLPEESSGNFSLHLFRNGVVMNDSLRGFRIFQDDYITTKKFNALPIYQLHQEHRRQKLSPGDTLTVQIESVTKEYATFIENARQELRGPIPLFGGPPANVETNIYCLSSNSKTEVSGFFTAYSKYKVSTIYE